MKYKQLYLGFEFRLPIPFPMITVTLNLPIWYCISLYDIVYPNMILYIPIRYCISLYDIVYPYMILYIPVWYSMCIQSFRWSGKILVVFICHQNLLVFDAIKISQAWKGESKVSQYFGNMRHKFSVPAAFDEFVKVMNHTELRGAEFVWNFPSVTHRIYLYGKGLELRTHAFRPNWHYLIIEVLTTQAKFFQSYGYCNVINWAFTFYSTNVFGCFCGVIALFKLVKHKFPN